MKIRPLSLRARLVLASVLVEGVMITSTTLWLSVAALCYLIVINGVATGVTLSIGKRT